MQIEESNRISDITEKATRLFIGLLLDHQDASVNDVINILCGVVAGVAVTTYQGPLKDLDDAKSAQSSVEVKDFIEQVIKRLKGFNSGKTYWCANKVKDHKSKGDEND